MKRCGLALGLTQAGRDYMAKYSGDMMRVVFTRSKRVTCVLFLLRSSEPMLVDSYSVDEAAEGMLSDTTG